jgi:hypothetical protein
MHPNLQGYLNAGSSFRRYFLHIAAVAQPALVKVCTVISLAPLFDDELRRSDIGPDHSFRVADPSSIRDHENSLFVF